MGSRDRHSRTRSQSLWNSSSDPEAVRRCLLQPVLVCLEVWHRSSKLHRWRSVAILAQAISCSNVRCVFPVHELFWFCLVQVSTTQFCSFSAISHATCERRNRCAKISGACFLCSNMGSPCGSLPDVEGTWEVTRTSAMEENSKRNMHTNLKIAATHAEYIHIRKLRPDAFPDSGLV